MKRRSCGKHAKYIYGPLSFFLSAPFCLLVYGDRFWFRLEFWFSSMLRLCLVDNGKGASSMWGPEGSPWFVVA
jgi:hypothetical protein